MAILRRVINLNKEHVEAFEQLFPEASLSWALDMLLEKFVAQYNQSPAELAEVASQELKEEHTN